MIKVVDNNKVNELIAKYKNQLNSALDFQAEGKITEYIRSLIELQRLAESLEYIQVQN